jgi:hypothetical protein
VGIKDIVYNKGVKICFSGPNKMELRWPGNKPFEKNKIEEGDGMPAVTLLKKRKKDEHI